MRAMTLTMVAKMGAVAVLSGGMLVAQAPGPGTTSGTPVAPAAGSVSGSPRAEAGMTTDTGRVAMSMGDQKFVNKAVQGNVGEIAAAKMALDKSSNDQVKQFAQKMVDDHTKMLNDLKQVADQAGLKYEEKPSPETQKIAAKLQGLNGAAFDKAFVNAMVKDHKEDVALFSAESQNGKVEPLMKAAAASLPVIQEHLQMVQGLQKSGV